jgi:hypothetical protein
MVLVPVVSWSDSDALAGSTTGVSLDRFFGGRPRFRLVTTVDDCSANAAAEDDDEEEDAAVGTELAEESGITVLVVVVLFVVAYVDVDDDDDVDAAIAAAAAALFDFPPGRDSIIFSADFRLGGLPGPRFTTGGGGGIDIDASIVDHESTETTAAADAAAAFGDGLEGDALGETFVASFVSSTVVCPFFFFVVKVVGLSSVYIVVGVRCLLGRLRF